MILRRIYEAFYDPEGVISGGESPNRQKEMAICNNILI